MMYNQNIMNELLIVFDSVFRHLHICQKIIMIHSFQILLIYITGFYLEMKF